MGMSLAEVCLVWRRRPFTKRCAGRNFSNDYFSLPPTAKTISAANKSLRGKTKAYQHQLASRPAVR